MSSRVETTDRVCPALGARCLVSSAYFAESKQPGGVDEHGYREHGGDDGEKLYKAATDDHKGAVHILREPKSGVPGPPPPPSVSNGQLLADPPVFQFSVLDILLNYKNTVQTD